MKRIFLLLFFISSNVFAQLNTNVMAQKCIAYATLVERVYSLLVAGESPTNTVTRAMVLAKSLNIPEDLVYVVTNRAMATIQNKSLNLEQFVIFESGYCVGRLEAALGQAQQRK